MSTGISMMIPSLAPPPSLQSTGPTFFSCPDCNYKTSSSRKLGRHRSVNHAGTRYCCQQCNFVTGYQSNFYRHRKQVHNGEAVQYVIQSNGSSPATGPGVQSSPKTIPGMNMPTSTAAPLVAFPPPNSNSIFPPSALAAAAAAAFSTLPPMWPCLDCGMKLTSQLHWLEHRRVYHSQPEPLNLSLSKPVVAENGAHAASYRCGDCREDFMNKSQWQEHMRTYHRSTAGLTNGVEEGRNCNGKAPNGVSSNADEVGEFICAECGEDFDRKSTWLAHRKVHESESSAASPNEDDQQVSEPDEEPLDPLVIDESEIMANPTDEILAPEIRSNGASMLAELGCPDCKFVTTDEIRYRKHVRCHQNSAPRACSRCEFASVYSWNMERHMQSHGAAGKFVCNRCDFSQNSRQAMQFHVENHHSVQMRHAESQTDADAEFEEAVGVDAEPFVFEIHALKVNENFDEDEKSQRNFVAPFGADLAPFDEKIGIERMSSGSSSELSLVTSAASDHIGGLVGGLQSQQPRRQMTLDELASNANRVKSLPKYMSEHEVIETPSEPANIKEYEKDPDIKQRTCSVCGYQGKWISEMVRHKRVHTNERPFKCKYCSRTSKWKADLIRHVAKAHGVRVVSKYSRSRTFDSDSQKMRAFKEAHGYLEGGVENNSMMQDLPIDGDLDESFESAAELAPETPELSPITSPVPTTPNSLKEFLSERQQANPQYAILAKYLEVLTGDAGEPVLRCRQCPYETHDLHTFRAHTQKHENKKPYQCSTCGYRSNWSSDVHKHIRLKKIGHEKAYVIRLHPEIESRPDSTASNGSLAEKSSPMKIPANSVWKCAKCDFICEAKSPDLVVNHLEKSHNLPAFACRDCNFTSSSRKTCIFHAQTIHNCSDPEMIEENVVAVELGGCNGSDSGFSSGKRSSNSDAESVPEQKRLKFAEAIAHQRPQGEQQQQLFKCTRCPFDSIDLLEYKAHTVGHGQQTVPFMYQCVFCDWMASKKPTIFQHLKLHTGDPERHMALVEKRFLNGSMAAAAGVLKSPADAKPFRCDLCPFGTEVPQYFEYHRLVHSMQAAMGFPFGFLPFSTTTATAGIPPGLMLPANPALMIPNGNEILKAHASLIAKVGCGAQAGSNLGVPSAAVANDALLSDFNAIIDAAESQTSPAIAAAGASLVKPVNAHFKPGGFAMGSTPTAIASTAGATAKLTNGLTPVNAGPSGEIQKVTVLIGGQPRKMWQCRYCPHVSKRRANVRLHEKKHFKSKHHGSAAAALLNSPTNDRRLDDDDDDETEDCPAGPSMFVLQSPKKRMLNEYKERNSTANDATAEKSFGVAKSQTTLTNANSKSAESAPSAAASSAIALNKPKKHDCDKCPAKFSDRAQLGRHERFHGVNLKLKCFLCNYAVNFRINMTKHLKNHHKIADLEGGMAECRKHSKLFRKGRKSTASKKISKFDEF